MGKAACDEGPLAIQNAGVKARLGASVRPSAVPLPATRLPDMDTIMRPSDRLVRPVVPNALLSPAVAVHADGRDANGLLRPVVLDPPVARQIPSHVACRLGPAAPFESRRQLVSPDVAVPFRQSAAHHNAVPSPAGRRFTSLSVVTASPVSIAAVDIS